MLPSYHSCIHSFMKHLKTTSSAQGLCYVNHEGCKGQWSLPWRSWHLGQVGVQGVDTGKWLPHQILHFPATPWIQGWPPVILPIKWEWMWYVSFSDYVFKKSVCLLHAFIFHLLEAKESRPHNMAGAQVSCSAYF